MATTNREILLAARPNGFPQPADFELAETSVDDPSAGQFLVQGLYLSVDPYMRGRMNDVKSYADPVGIGDRMVGEVVGRVIQSQNDRFPEGTLVAGMFGWQEYALSDGQAVRRLPDDIDPPSLALHVLGMPGMTAYFGLLDVCQLKEGENVFVSAAAGAVGSVVGQIAKLKGCHVVGSAGSDDKLQFLTSELGFDAGLNYKTTSDLAAALRDLCPDGIDVYFDNVGGPITDAVFPRLNTGARVGICGQISQYNLEEPEQGPRQLWHLIVKRATVTGFLVFDFADQFREAMAQMAGWYAAGKIKYRERVVDGLENAPTAFVEMMQGANTGKQLVRLAE
jgi:NADPH-dependent curcumin reductase CurA